MKLKVLENILGKKTNILKEDFEVVMDSRLVKKGSLFIAINKGNEYVKEAIEKGAFVIYDKEDLNLENAFYVKNSIEFMQEFAEKYRIEKNFFVIGITGSNGKTTLKDIIYNVLDNKGVKAYKTQGNYNNHIGLPFTILSSSDKDEILVLEMGMSNLGEIDLLAKISKPDYSIITNIGHSHLEMLKTRDNVFKSKTELIRHTKNLVFVNENDEYLSDLKRYKKEDLNKVKLVTTSEFKTNLLGNFNKINISLANALLEKMGYKDNNYENIKITDGRFQIIEGDITYINDAYNASPISMEASIKTFSNLFNDSFKIMVLADMLELGEKEIDYHEALYNVIEESKFNILFLYGNRMKYLYNKLKNLELLKLQNNEKLNYSFLWFFDKKDIIKDIKNIKTSKKKIVLLKGSRGMKLEEIMEDEK